MYFLNSNDELAQICILHSNNHTICQGAWFNRVQRDWWIEKDKKRRKWKSGNKTPKLPDWSPPTHKFYQSTASNTGQMRQNAKHHETYKQQRTSWSSQEWTIQFKYQEFINQLYYNYKAKSPKTLVHSSGESLYLTSSQDLYQMINIEFFGDVYSRAMKANWSQSSFFPPLSANSNQQENSKVAALEQHSDEWQMALGLTRNISRIYLTKLGKSNWEVIPGN